MKIIGFHKAVFFILFLSYVVNIDLIMRQNVLYLQISSIKIVRYQKLGFRSPQMANKLVWNKT